VKGYFAQVRRAGFDIGLSTRKLAKAMVEVQDRPREKLSAAGHGRLAALATKEGMTPDELLGRLISSWRRATR
jgi:hypothetical protein